MKNSDGLDLATIAAHGLRAPAPETLPAGERGVPSAEPLYLTSVLDFESIEAWEAPMSGAGGFVYARHGMPNGRSLELTMAALEGGEDALATSSGMAAVACGVLALAQMGERVLVQRDAYGGTLTMMAQDFGRMGVSVDAVDVYDLAAVAEALERPGAPVKALICESISNPLVREADVAGLARLAHARGVTLVVDATFATPVIARPLGDGADVVLHSATKFLGGHHDLCAGVLVGKKDFIARARGVAKRMGMVASPMDAWLCSRGIRTLGVRMERCQENARMVAAKLRGHLKVKAVHYGGRGALLSFDVGDGAAARRVVAALELITLTPSLGGTSTSVSHPATSSHRGMSAETRAALGIGDGLIRVSVGIEAVADVWKDLERALASALTGAAAAG